MSHKISRLENIAIVVLFTTFMGQIYWTPFESDFRLTFAVVVLNILMLNFSSINPFVTINLVGLAMFVVRSLVFVISENVDFLEAVTLYYPVLFFYFFYALFFEALKVRMLLKKPLSLFLAIWICDTIPNLIELMIRREWDVVGFEKALYTLVLIGLFRTLVTVLLIYTSFVYKSKINARNQYLNYIEKIDWISKLKTELFFLKKSTNDIEETMRKSYALYERLVDEEKKECALSIAREIHEIKKDYHRVISGLSKNVDEMPVYEMDLDEIIQIVFDAQMKLSLKEEKKIKFESTNKIKLKTQSFCELISILNNLIHNAVDAIEGDGFVKIQTEKNQHYLILRVMDSGAGIQGEDLPLIFEPGFSTKFNSTSGIMSSGIGLTHVKYLIESFFEGAIEVEPTEVGTCFVLKIKSKCLEHIE